MTRWVRAMCNHSPLYTAGKIYKVYVNNPDYYNDGADFSGSIIYDNGQKSSNYILPWPKRLELCNAPFKEYAKQVLK